MSDIKKLKTAIIGCGMISVAYFKGAQKFPSIEIVACCDSLVERAKEKAEEYGVAVKTNQEIYADPEIELIINLTPPMMHSQVNMEALNAGKHVYTEKPFGVDAQDAAKTIALAKEKGLRIGSAPDTFLGAGYQTCRKLLDDGWIGKPISATAIIMGRGPEKWGQAPFFYDYGAGPMLDMGPYYITALVNLFGPAKSIVAMTKKGSEYRTFGPEVAEQYKDQYKPYGKYPVNVTTHLTGIIEFHNGVYATVITSFEAYGHNHPPIEIYGDEGTMCCPDPNKFEGPVKILRKGGSEEWVEAPLSHIYSDNNRSIGAADMAVGIRNNRQHRCNGDLAWHVLDIMLSFDKASELGTKIELETTCERPATMPIGLDDGQIPE